MTGFSGAQSLSPATWGIKNRKIRDHCGLSIKLDNNYYLNNNYKKDGRDINRQSV
jgi:hypothetical protein